MKSKRKAKGIIAAVAAAASAIAIAVGGIFISKINDKSVAASAATSYGAYSNILADGSYSSAYVTVALGIKQTSKVYIGNDGGNAIAWRVLRNDNTEGVTSSSILLFADKGVDSKKFNTSYSTNFLNAYWYKSLPRAYLNGFSSYYDGNTQTSLTPSDSFYQAKLNNSERALINTTDLITGGYMQHPSLSYAMQTIGNFANQHPAVTSFENGNVTYTDTTIDNNPSYGYSAIERTKDKLFLLDYHEIYNPAYGFTDNASYPVYNGADKYHGTSGLRYGYVCSNGYANVVGAAAITSSNETYWLRNAGHTSSGDTALAVYHDSNGCYITSHYYVNYALQLRPAMNIQPEGIVFATASTPTDTITTPSGAPVPEYKLYLNGGGANTTIPTVVPDIEFTSTGNQMEITVDNSTAATQLVFMATPKDATAGGITMQATAAIGSGNEQTATFNLGSSGLKISTIKDYNVTVMLTSGNGGNFTEDVYAVGANNYTLTVNEPTDVPGIVYNSSSRNIDLLAENTDPALNEKPQWFKDINYLLKPLEYSDGSGTVVNAINAGTYKVKVELKDGVGKWSGTPGTDESDTVRYITLTIDKRKIDLTWTGVGGDATNFNYEYDGKVHTPTVVVAASETVKPAQPTVSYKDGKGQPVTSPKDNGTYTATAALSTADDKNFEIKSESKTKTFSIGAKQLAASDIKWGTETYTYNGSEQNKPTAKYTVNGTDKDLDVVFTDSSVTEFKNAGTYNFTAKLKSGDNNVTLPSTGTTKDYQIKRAPLTIVWKSGDDAKFTYNDSNPAMVSDLTGFITGEETLKADFIKALEDSVSQNDKLFYDTTDVTANGSVTLLNDLEVGTNYVIKQDVFGKTYVIERAALQVKAADADIAMGDKLPKLTATLIGLLGSDNSDATKKQELQDAVNAALKAQDSSGNAYTTSSPKGDYDIVLGSLKSGTETGSYVLDNYVITYTGATLKVKAGKIKVTFNGHTAVQYGTKKEDALKGVTVTVDKISASALNIETDYTASMNAGDEYTIFVTFKNEADKENYSLEYANDKYNVKKRVITAAEVEFDEFTQVYDGKAHGVTAGVKISGLDTAAILPTLNVEYTVKNGDGTVLNEVMNAATYVATANLAPEEINWEFQTGNVATTEITVKPAPLNISLVKTDYTVEYGEELDINDIELSFGGIIAGEETAIKEAFEISAKDGKGKPYTTAAVPSDTKFTVLATLSDKNAVSNYAITGLDETTGVLTGVSGTLQVLKKKINVQVDYTSLDFGGEVTGKLTDGISIGGKTYDELVDSGIYEFTFYFTPAGGEPQVIGDISQHPQVGEDGKINMMGEYSFTVSLTNYGAARYDWAGTALHEDVSLAEVAGDGSVRVTVTAEGWTYGETAKQPTVTTMPATDGGTAFTVEIEWYDGTNWNKWTESQPKNAGTYSVRARTKASANYPASSWKTATLVIAPKTLTVKVAMNEESTEVKAGTAASELTNLWTVTATGFVGEDTYDFTAFAENYSATTAAGTEVNVKITRADLTGVLANYEIIYEENAKFTVIEDPEPVTPPVEDPPVEDPPTDDPNTDKPNEDDPKPVEPGVTNDDNDKGLPDGFPLWQVIVGGISIILIAVFIAKICANVGATKEYKQKTAGAYAGVMVNGMLFGISDTWWTVISLSLAGVALILFIVVLATTNAMKKARRACEAEDKRRHDEEMKMLMMMMKNPQPAPTYAAPAVDVKEIVTQVVAALLPTMQQSSAQITAGGGEYDDSELRRRIEELESKDDGFDDVVIDYEDEI